MKIAKSIVSLAVAAALIVPVMPAHSSAVKYTAINNGLLQNNRMLIPLRAVAEQLGANVDWNNSTKTVTIFKGDAMIELTVNSDTVYINGMEMTIDVPLVQRSSVTYVPLRFVSQALGAKIEWNQYLKRATVFYNGDRIDITAEKRHS
ncbi:stalk domain-containing protein [Paenibacillus xylaniclasticus]|uniref:stalk domain-containing protein n=1 Tax=Paenibacillus xylaniclasticus TaxID=588083 RepID=UPI000FD8A023|nr:MULTISPECIES: stalk domain-containing protein [Paenibacillus]GFN31799.1 hypothetical protein PCURB6_20590 [Paenibacillus curdlanolyticus]